jgi:hypothetical protein
MFLYAEHAVRSEHLPLFDALRAAKPDSVVANEVNETIIRAGEGQWPSLNDQSRFYLL